MAMRGPRPLVANMLRCGMPKAQWSHMLVGLVTGGSLMQCCGTETSFIDLGAVPHVLLEGSCNLSTKEWKRVLVGRLHTSLKVCGPRSGAARTYMSSRYSLAAGNLSSKFRRRATLVSLALGERSSGLQFFCF